tara:strand:- start:217 stop:636 length:420 start_codon:yes stop_codon:yes gene_type:complete
MSKFFIEIVVEQQEVGGDILDMDHGKHESIMDFIRLPMVDSKQQIYNDLENENIEYNIALKLWWKGGDYDTEYFNYDYENIFAEGFSYHASIEKKILRLIRLAMKDERATALQTLLSKEYRDAVNKKEEELTRKEMEKE